MIWRRLLVRSDLTLFGLHRVIQIAFGWEDYHLHAFKVHGRRFGTQRTGERHHLVEDGKILRELTLADLSLRVRQRMMYEYDRSEERRVGKEWVSTGRSRCSPYH